MLLVGLAVLGALAGCGGDDIDAYREPAATTTQAASAPTTTSGGGTAATAVAGSAMSAAPLPVETRAEILLLAGPQLDGQQFDLAAAAGSDVLLWFWAPW